MHKTFNSFLLLCESDSNDIYTAHEAAKQVGTTSAELQKYCKRYYGDEHIYIIAVERCCVKIGRASLLRKITTGDAEKYLLENGRSVNHLLYFQEKAKIKAHKEKHMSYLKRQFRPMKNQQ